MTTYFHSERPSLDYHLHREVAAQLRSEFMRSAVAKGISAMKPSRRSLRTLGLAVLVATGAFSTVMLSNPSQTVAADPSTVTGSFSPLDLKIPSGLPIATYDAN